MSTLRESETFWSQVCFDRNYRPEGRYQVYRELVTERMFDVLKSVCPVAYGILGDDRLWDLLWDYLRDDPPQCEILRELPRLVSAYLRRGKHPLLAEFPYLGELMEYEFLEVRMIFFPEESGDEAEEGKLRLNPAHVLADYEWPVHFIGEEFSDAAKIPRGRFHLLLWREPKSLEVEFMEVNPLVASLIRRLETGDGKPADLLADLAAEHGISDSDEFAAEGSALLEELRQKGILR